MNARKPASARPQTTVVLGMLALMFVVFIILFPDKAFQASLQGLNVWWKLVFPALLPFFILTEIMAGMGVIHGIGKLLEPLMRRMFGLPGAGGWPLAVGWIAGFPGGAAATQTIAADKLVRPHEADKLLALSHTCSPIFLMTVVGVGFLQNPRLGLVLAVIHYASAAVLALIAARFRSAAGAVDTAADEPRSPWLEHPDPGAGLLAKAMFAIKLAQRNDGRTFGKLLGDSVVSAVQNLMAIGGYMMMFSVLIAVIHLSGLIEWISRLSGAIGISPEAAYQLLTLILPALTEVHLGAFAISQSDALPPIWQAALLSAGLAWGGSSAHLQIKSLTAGIGIRFARFIGLRALHALLAFITTLIAWTPLNRYFVGAEPSFFSLTGGAGIDSGTHALKNGLWFLISPMMLQLAVILLFLLVLSIGISFIWRNRQGE
ncbi:nucleoside recognition domain-containing protein [Paenibacillus hamazuiensis]|uniref:nucleoside recognition domain-containing protein n=1 Tax=Paenibacillus hamazuiensis TaxID=2936508 RepID=UPI00200F2A60|nr:nucleoside recognition domain-containing protein [Paenibacillus hamazuiensis]